MCYTYSASFPSKLWGNRFKGFSASFGSENFTNPNPLEILVSVHNWPKPTKILPQGFCNKDLKFSLSY